MNPILGDKLGKLGDNTKLPENAGIMILSLLGVEISSTFERSICDVTSCRKRYTESSSSGSVGALTAVQADELIDEMVNRFANESAVIDSYW
ncbi:hypothetical protein AVEN_198689-1 [Araneus ventricosus]|uniref:Uncharacterized protein n=1 Tax=Araneus ventricosus TaxID=182803 RepID=A0A4Y2HEF7_ARAVE|nr:hypothetical protein AVEN_198689-1 [Araneus ventricosus]